MTAAEAAQTGGAAARPRARKNGAGQQTRQRLLDTAERLFAQRGLANVSVRDITDESGANTASIHYHFGSKRELVAAIFERRAEWLGHRREELLDAIESAGSVDLRSVVEAMVLPTAELANGADEGGRHYIAFLADLAGDEDALPAAVHAYERYTARYLAMLARVTPELPEDVRLLRFAVAKDLINRAFGRAAGVHGWLHEHEQTIGFASTVLIVDMIVGLMGAPATEPTPARAERRGGPRRAARR